MHDSNIFPIGPARPRQRGASSPASLPEVLDLRGVPPIPAEHLRRIFDDRPARHVVIEAVTLADDWRDFLSEVRGSPYSHAAVAIFAIIFWTVLLVAPTLLGLL